MTLTLNKLDTQLQAMGRELAARQQQLEELRSEASRLLRQHAGEHVELAERARQSARDLRWWVAIPADEPLGSACALPPHPPQATLLAADGSVVEPDRHGAALYALLNIGSIALEHGTGRRPSVASEPLLFYEDEDLYEDGELLQGNLLDIRRATAEMEKLADLADEARLHPILALCDGSLLLWFPKDTPLQEQRTRMGEYMRALARLRAAGAVPAGVMSRPHHAEVIKLVYLASLGRQATRQDMDQNPFEGLEDRQLFAFLKPGERSALYFSSAPTNAQYAASWPEHEVAFFYLNVGDERQAEIARVEIPRWAATETIPSEPGSSLPEGYRFIDLAQAAIYRQCRIARSYPYILARAHELAVVSVEERRDLELRVIAAMARHGLAVQPSEKAQLKELTGSRRRRYGI